MFATHEKKRGLSLVKCCDRLEMINIEYNTSSRVQSLVNDINVLLCVFFPLSKNEIVQFDKMTPEPTQFTFNILPWSKVWCLLDWITRQVIRGKFESQFVEHQWYGMFREKLLSFNSTCVCLCVNVFYCEKMIFWLNWMN